MNLVANAIVFAFSREGEGVGCFRSLRFGEQILQN